MVRGHPEIGWLGRGRAIAGWPLQPIRSARVASQHPGYELARGGANREQRQPRYSGQRVYFSRTDPVEDKFANEGSLLEEK